MVDGAADCARHLVALAKAARIQVETATNDERMVELALSGDPEAFGEIVRRWERRIFALAFGMRIFFPAEHPERQRKNPALPAAHNFTERLWITRQREFNHPFVVRGCFHLDSCLLSPALPNVARNKPRRQPFRRAVLSASLQKMSF